MSGSRYTYVPVSAARRAVPVPDVPAVPALPEVQQTPGTTGGQRPGNKPAREQKWRKEDRHRVGHARNVHEWNTWCRYCTQRARHWASQGLGAWAQAWEEAKRSGRAPALTHDGLDADTKRRLTRAKPSRYQGAGFAVHSASSPVPECSRVVVKHPMFGFASVYKRVPSSRAWAAVAE